MIWNSHLLGGSTPFTIYNLKNKIYIYIYIYIYRQWLLYTFSKLHPDDTRKFSWIPQVLSVNDENNHQQQQPKKKKKKGRLKIVFMLCVYIYIYICDVLYDFFLKKLVDD